MQILTCWEWPIGWCWRRKRSPRQTFPLVASPRWSWATTGETTLARFRKSPLSTLDRRYEEGCPHSRPEWVAWIQRGQSWRWSSWRTSAFPGWSSGSRRWRWPGRCLLSEWSSAAKKSNSKWSWNGYSVWSTFASACTGQFRPFSLLKGERKKILQSTLSKKPFSKRTCSHLSLQHLQVTLEHDHGVTEEQRHHHFNDVEQHVENHQQEDLLGDELLLAGCRRHWRAGERDAEQQCQHRVEDRSVEEHQTEDVYPQNGDEQRENGLDGHRPSTTSDLLFILITEVVKVDHRPHADNLPNEAAAGEKIEDKVGQCAEHEDAHRRLENGP